MFRLGAHVGGYDRTASGVTLGRAPAHGFRPKGGGAASLVACGKRICPLLGWFLTTATLTTATLTNATLTTDALADFDSSIRPLLEQYCVRCHGGEQQDARIRYDQMVGYDAADGALWMRVHEVLGTGQMPPEDEPQPTELERRRILDWIADRQAAGKALAASGIVRRLNRREFSASLQDLTGVAIDFGKGLPDDGRTDGFDTGALGLQDAADSVAQFLEVSRQAVDSIRFREPDRDRRIAIDFREHEFTDFRTFVDQHWGQLGIASRSKGLKSHAGIGIFLPTRWTGDRDQTFLTVPVPADGRGTLQLTLRVTGKRPLPGLPVPTLWVKIGGTDVDYRAVDERPQILTYAVRMEDQLVEDGLLNVQLTSYVEVPYAVAGFENDDRGKADGLPGGLGVYRPKFDRKRLRSAEEQPVPSVIVESLGIDYDHRVLWPPAGWNANLDLIGDDESDARRLLGLWIERAWRRPVADAEVAKFVEFYRELRGQDFGFDDALRAAFRSVLMGGPFRYLDSPSDPNPVLARHAIASRLSYMLAGSPPDSELRRLAARGKLRDPRVLDEQVDRLLDDPRRDAFFRPFVTQWLDLSQPITLAMSHRDKQDFRFARHLKSSMKEETIQYVARLFADNRPARELISSDWTMMNDILAVHYGYEGIEGAELRKVLIRDRPDDPRGGGILGHAGIQSMLCWMGDNWVIYRGAWTLKHLLDDPPPPPPLEIPELIPSDDENRGKAFRELLARHQEDRNCTICHRKMDPLGFAFQNFDLSGRWRNVEHERYHRYELDGKIEWRGEGATRPVDAAGRLPRGEEFVGFLECKELLASHYLDDIVRGLLKKLTLYGTGRVPDTLDLATIARIMGQESENGYALRDLLKALIRSRVFLEADTTNRVGDS